MKVSVQLKIDKSKSIFTSGKIFEMTLQIFGCTWQNKLMPKYPRRSQGPSFLGGQVLLKYIAPPEISP